MKKYGIHSDFKKYSFYIPFNKTIIYLSRLPQKIMWVFTRIPNEIKLKKVKVEIDHKKMSLFIFREKESLTDLPCLLYFHGGAFAYKAGFHHKKLAAMYAKNAKCCVIFPDYSLMPRFRKEKIEKETLLLYKYVLNKYKELKINKNKIIIGGDSAGGYLAMNLTCQLSYLEIHEPCAQMLIYPAINPKKETKSLQIYLDTPRWDAMRNKKMWNYYFQNINSVEVENAYLENRDFSKLNLNTYLEVAEFDPLHDEGILYGKILTGLDLAVQIEETKKTIHGYDMNLKSGIVDEAVRKRIKFLKDNFK